MKLAAIDIGSNAIRLQIVQSYLDNGLVSFKKLQFLRFPLRLGEEVFGQGEISETTLSRFSLLMKTFHNLIDLYEVDGYSAVATSAMREAKNGKAAVKKVRKEAGIHIDVISGSEEASILYKAIIPFLQHEKKYIHIDVGGGSTELNIFNGKKLKRSKSFRMGSVRKLSKSDRAATFLKMKNWISEANISKSDSIEAIGTGGNINKLFRIANKEKGNALPLSELNALRAYVKSYSIPKRIQYLKMNPDRADVIIPASKIYINSMKYAKSDHIIVPRVGLKDGLIYELYERISGERIEQIEFMI